MTTHAALGPLQEFEVTNEEALKRFVRPGMTIASGFATSEPHTFYAALWDHILQEDLVDLRIHQALYMAPHRLCVGDALQARGVPKSWTDKLASTPLAGFGAKVHLTTRKLDGLRRLIAHYEELRRRRIVMCNGFMGATTNMVVPDNLLTRKLFPEYVGRNTSRNGVTDMHSIHFPDGIQCMFVDADGKLKVDGFVAVVTPPDENGELSNGPANGANSDAIDHILRSATGKMLLYVNPAYPFTRGYGDAANTTHIDRLVALGRQGRLLVVHDEGKIPALPPDSFKNISREEESIAHNVVNHIEMLGDKARGRALQVGIGGTGVLAIRALRDSSWTGRCYTEMLEPFTLDLFDAGKIAGSHFLESSGQRTMLDGKLVCTFTLAEGNSDFFQRIHNNPAVIIAPASRVVIPEAFYGGLGINNCLGIDFQGHVNSGGRDRNHFTGIGGAAMIMRGLAKGGLAYLCLKSTHLTPEGKLRSSIFPFLPEGTPVSIVGPDTTGGREGARTFLVTEHGVAQVSNLSQSNYIRALISVADPRFRDKLKHQAWEQFRVRA